MTSHDRLRWERRYREEKWSTERKAFPLVVEHARPLSDGLALDVACGLGHNVAWLAGHGYRVIGMDISRTALLHAAAALRRRRLSQRALLVQVDLDQVRLPPSAFDLICVIRFLKRELIHTLKSALKPGGQVIYATLNWRWSVARPDIPLEYLLQPGELPALFGGFEQAYYTEDGNVTCLVAFRPSAPPR
jgi:SAM-dependent methyltransferase